MDFSLEALGDVVRKRRVAKNLTQEELGRAAGYGTGAGVSISRLESGLTRPGYGRFEGIAAALGMTPGQLEAEAAARSRVLASERQPADRNGSAPGGKERLKDRLQRIQREIERRTTTITELGEAFNHAHDRARDDFFMPFVTTAARVRGAPQPDQEQLRDDDVTDAEAKATLRFRVASYGVARVLAGGAGGAAAGATMGGAAAYGTFMAAVSWGTASTGAAISGLSGVAASNAALALLGGGTLAAGGAGVAGGTMLLTGLVAAPAALLAAGGLVWMVKRNRKQQQELAEKLDQVEAELAATRKGFEALVDILPRATQTLDYIAVHASHALGRWERQLGDRPLKWASLETEEKARYQNFIDIAASQLALVTINVQDLMTSEGADRERLIELADDVLTESQTRVEALV